ncbi:MAG: DUF1572 domain-containing protein [Bacteroidetes bacterium]|nr:DUF1572 domain-containing protein [Bacteroidota bacterium]
MQVTSQLARNLREVHFGVNWTWVNMKDSLKDVDWQQATTKVHSFNTIATLVYHTHYFIVVTAKVLEGNPLDAHDKYSFDHPPIQSEQDWEQFLDTVWASANHFAELVEQLPDSRLWETFVEEKYGTYYRNIQGIIEHTHYHLGQITLLKKLLLEG